jgi:hypothetical protein
LLLLTPSRGFEYVAPVLIGAGSLVILRGPVKADAATGLGSGPDGAADGVLPVPDAREGWLSRAGIFAVAVYIGYFGAAGGVLMLALLIRLSAQSLARTNALKNVVSGLANAVAGLGFAIFGPVRWTAALPLAVGFLIGGWIGPSLVRHLPARGLRLFIGLCGFAVAIRLAVSAYR